MTVRDEKLYQALGDARQLLGLGASPDDCNLALRGLQTLAVRLKHLEESTLQIAHWLETQPEIDLILHPAFPSCPGHEFWKRDFTGSTSVFSVVFKPEVDRAAILEFADSLQLFKLGYSWGGVTSLVMPRFGLNRQHRSYGDRLVRLNVGLETPQDLIADLTRGFNVLRS